MVNFHSSAIFLFLSNSLVSRLNAFSPSLWQSTRSSSMYSIESRAASERRLGKDVVAVSATASTAFASMPYGEDDTWQNFLSSTSNYLNSLSRKTIASQNDESNATDQDDDPSFAKTSNTAASVSGAGNAVILSRDVARQTITYEAALSLYSTTAMEQLLGMTLRQIDQRGQMSSVVLDLDTLQYVSASTLSNSELGEQHDGDEKVMSEECNADFAGVVVYSVRTNGSAYKAGVRPGDFVLATSATIGDVSFFA